eukprot:6477710-Amphidinium_carterae.1
MSVGRCRWSLLAVAVAARCATHSGLEAYHTPVKPVYSVHRQSVRSVERATVRPSSLHTLIFKPPGNRPIHAPT